MGADESSLKTIRRSRRKEKLKGLMPLQARNQAF